MIGRIEGQLVEITDNVVLVAVGGVGYELEVTDTALARLPAGALAIRWNAAGRVPAVAFYTHFVVREDAQQLYGLRRAGARSVSRTHPHQRGRPKLALNVIFAAYALADLSASRCSAPDTAFLTRVPGIGRKTAERLLVELAANFRRWR